HVDVVDEPCRYACDKRAVGFDVELELQLLQCLADGNVTCHGNDKNRRARCGRARKAGEHVHVLRDVEIEGDKYRVDGGRRCDVACDGERKGGKISGAIACLEKKDVFAIL